MKNYLDSHTQDLDFELDKKGNLCTCVGSNMDSHKLSSLFCNTKHLESEDICDDNKSYLWSLEQRRVMTSRRLLGEFTGMTMQCIGNMTSSQSRLVPHLGAWQRASPARRRWWKEGGNGSSPWEVGTKLKISDKCLTGMFVLCVFYRVQEDRINEQINCES